MVLKEVIVWSLIVESVILLGRLHFGSIEARHRAFKSIKFLHFYLGLVLLILYYFGIDVIFLLLAGWIMVVSYLLHHFLVLPLVRGHMEIP